MTEDISVFTYIVIGVISGLLGGTIALSLLNFLKSILKKIFSFIKTFYLKIKSYSIFIYCIKIKKEYEDEYLTNTLSKLSYSNKSNSLNYFDKELLKIYMSSNIPSKKYDDEVLKGFLKEIFPHNNFDIPIEVNYSLLKLEIYINSTEFKHQSH